MWTTLPKPTGTPYSNVNPAGKEQYDQASITYDDPNVFYDGGDPSSWTDILKPSGGGGGTILIGMATGLIMPPTYSTSHTIASDSWTKINKPI